MDRSDIYTKVGAPRWNALANCLVINARTNENVVIIARLYNGALARSSIVSVETADHSSISTPSPRSVVDDSPFILASSQTHPDGSELCTTPGCCECASGSYKKKKSQREVSKEYQYGQQARKLKMQEALFSAMKQQSLVRSAIVTPGPADYDSSSPIRSPLALNDSPCTGDGELFPQYASRSRDVSPSNVPRSDQQDQTATAFIGSKPKSRRCKRRIAKRQLQRKGLDNAAFPSELSERRDT